MSTKHVTAKVIVDVPKGLNLESLDHIHFTLLMEILTEGDGTMTILDEVEKCLKKEEQLDFFPQEECEDDIVHVQCYHCPKKIDPQEEDVYCWDLGSAQIFVCRGCDAKHRTNHKTTLQVGRYFEKYQYGIGGK
jgi:hypothetical protein